MVVDKTDETFLRAVDVTDVFIDDNADVFLTDTPEDSLPVEELFTVTLLIVLSETILDDKTDDKILFQSDFLTV